MSDSLFATVRHAQAGDRDARNRLLADVRPRTEKHVRLLLDKYGFGYLTRGHLEDIVQVCLEDLLLGLEDYEVIGSGKNTDKWRNEFLAWCSVRRTRRVVDYLRKEARHVPTQTEPVDESVSRPGYEAQSSATGTGRASGEQQVLVREIWRLIDTHLNNRERLVLKLLFRDGRSYKEVAAELGMSLNSIGAVKSRGVRKIRKVLSKGEASGS